jgi:hypothetical protein
MAAVPPHGLNPSIQALRNQGFVCTSKLLFAETDQAAVNEWLSV